jgi:hypothetical protein
MKRFRGFVVNEFYHIFRDYRTLLILFGMPALQQLLFGYVITNEIKDSKIAILDYSRDSVTRQIIPEVRMQYNPQLKGVYMFVPGIMVMLKGSGFREISIPFYSLVVYSLLSISLAVWRYRKVS